MFDSLLNLVDQTCDRLLSKMDFWAILGLLGQMVFTSRFVVQWIASERKKQSVVPVAFWYLSIAGSIVLLAYSIARADPIYILGFSLNTVIYVRNLVLIHRHRRLQLTDGAGGASGATG